MPKKVDIEAQRHRIADAAIEVIGRNGLSGARLRDVAQAADVTTGAVAHYFDDKDAVLAAALQRIVDEMQARMAKPGPAPSAGDLSAFIRRTALYLPLDEKTRGEWRVWLAFWGRAASDAGMRAAHRRHYRSIVGRLAEFLASLHPAAEAQAIEQTVDAMIAAIDGVGTRATLEPEAWPADRQEETLEKLVSPLLREFLATSQDRDAPARAGRG